MKKLFGAVAFIFMSSIVGQDTQVDQVSTNVLQELRSLPAKSVAFGKKLLDFEKAIDYLKGARDCLSGIGCSKRQSYLANYLLGATYGFPQQAAFMAIAQSDPARWTGNFAKGKPGLEAILVLPQILVNELGYRYLVKEKVSLFRCLTFRGCTDQTKRYAFYNLGIWSGRLGVILGMLGFKSLQQKWQERYIQIDNKEVKNTLGLDEGKNAFLWYEVLGFKKAPSAHAAKKKYRDLSRKYHPDKAYNVPTKVDLHGKIQRVLNAAHEKGNLK